MVKCADCGFLAVRLTAHKHEIVEAEPGLRERGIIVPKDYHVVPLCFVREYNLAKEIGDPSQGPKKILEIMQRDRECKAFTEWHQGFSPKEHAEMLLHEELRKSEREWREEQTKRDRDWRKEDVKLAREWRQEDVKRERESRQEEVKLAKASIRTMLLSAVIGFVAALAAVALTRLLTP